MWKVSMLFLFSMLTLVTFFGLPKGMKLVNKYWFPPEIRKYLLPVKYQPGTCIESPGRWGVQRKRVLGYSYKNYRTGYLLQDMDRYEHTQYIKKGPVERYARTVACR
jgi:hypothetical protein